jgi:hypothetical protein
MTDDDGWLADPEGVEKTRKVIRDLTRGAWFGTNV